MAEYLTNDTDLKKVADAIRAKGKTKAALSYPDEYVSAIGAITTGTELKIVANVTTGATVTATKGALAISGVSTDGSCTLIIPEAGTWSVKATLNGKPSDTKSVSIVDSYAVTLKFVYSVLNNNDWATIREVSDAGQGANYWSVGDYKTIVLNGTVGTTTVSNLTVSVFILGFNHNANLEGGNRIHFQIGKINGTMIGLVSNRYGDNTNTTGEFCMNTSYTNAGGWKDSHMRKTVLGSDSNSAINPTSGTFLAALPADLREVMKPITKYSDNTGGGNDTADYVTSTEDLLPLLSEFEYHGSRTYANSAEQNYQTQYDYYKAGNSKVHHKHNAIDTMANAWCRSVYSEHASKFCNVYTSGTADERSVYASFAVAPCFCV